MKFINDFVIDFGKKLVKIVHDYGKEAYVFYDDSWVGNEPYGKNLKNLDLTELSKQFSVVLNPGFAAGSR